MTTSDARASTTSATDLAAEQASASALESAARARGALANERALAYVEAARRRELPARHLTRRRSWVAALRLQVDAALLLMRAKLACAEERDGQHELSPDALQDALLELLRSEEVAAPPELARLRPLLSAPDSGALDVLTEADAELACDDFERALAFLASSIPLLRERERRHEWRMFAAGAALLASAALAGMLWSWTRAPNLALGHPVTAAGAGLHTSAEEAVNGVRFGELGYHSADKDFPWLQVDLAGEHAVREIQIYGRADCCLGQSMPMLVEGSIDGLSYVAFGQRNEPFQPLRPWVLTPSVPSVRYVRVRALKPVYLVIAELEVY